MIRRPWVAIAAAVLLLAAPARAAASTTPTATVRWEAGADADDVGLIGDSTLAGVRWADEYGALERFNFVFDAESCRRTLERSCWSREQYRPRTALAALEDHAGEWGDVLVMMTGYNDSAGGFADGVEAIVDEARDQGIGTVIWLSLRTRGVDYEEPLHLANGGTYREANRTLYELADRSDGYLQIADWASHSAEHPEWFESDGAHLAPAGVEPLTDFIAAQVDVVLAGGTVTPDPVPWEEVREGDAGDLVVDVQEALLEAGVDEVEVADGVFGPQTGEAVAEFQAREGLGVTGAVDRTTAIELGLSAATTTTTTPTTTLATTTSTTVVAAVAPTPPDRGSSAPMWWVVPAALPLLALVVVRRTRPRDAVSLPRPVRPYDHELEPG